jgi:hypothetical protein
VTRKIPSFLPTFLVYIDLLLISLLVSMHLMYVEENGQRKYTLKKVLGKQLRFLLPTPPRPDML